MSERFELLRRMLTEAADPYELLPDAPRCGSCGRVKADVDCEPDDGLCWAGLQEDPTCR